MARAAPASDERREPHGESQTAASSAPAAPSGLYARLFALVTAAALAVALFKILRSFIGPILWSVLFAFLLFPANRALRRVFGGRRAHAAMALTLAVVLGFMLPAFLVVIAFTRQASGLLTRLQAAAGRLQGVHLEDFLAIPVIGQAVSWIGSLTGTTIEEVEAWLVSAAKTLLSTLAAMSGPLVVEAFGTLVRLFVMLFLLFFFLRDGEDMVRVVRLLVPLDPRRQAHLAEHLSAVTRAVVFGSLVNGLAQGLLIGLAFALARLPTPVVFGALGGLTSMVPFFGTALVWVPAAGVLAYQARWGATAFMIAWGLLVVTAADHIIRPLFISGRARISTLPVFLGLAGGIDAFGPIGIVLGPVIVALVLALLRFAEESRSAASPAPGET
jgi:predicted PurR-regulated permease PerM